MTKDIWINLPVRDVATSTTFYKEIGFAFNLQAPNHERMSSFIVGENKLIINIFSEDLIESFSANKIADTNLGNEVLFSLGANNTTEVDEMLSLAERAGGKIYAAGGWKDGWMYGGGFIDLDGHRWNVLHMDFTKMPSS
jgi:predicted lactoylglutathione lyase